MFWLINLGLAYALAIALIGVAEQALWSMTAAATLGLAAMALFEQRHGCGNRLMTLTCLWSGVILIVVTVMMLI